MFIMALNSLLQFVQANKTPPKNVEFDTPFSKLVLSVMSFRGSWTQYCQTE